MIKNISLSLAPYLCPWPLVPIITLYYISCNYRRCTISIVTLLTICYICFLIIHTCWAMHSFFLFQSFNIPFPVSDFSKKILPRMKILGDLGCSESSSNLAYFKQIAFWKGKSGLTSSMLCHNDPSVFMFSHGTVHVGRE